MIFSNALLVYFFTLIFFSVIFFCPLAGKSQIVTGQNALDIDGGKSDIGYIIHAGYIHFLSSKFSIKGDGFFETGNPYQLQYKNYGIDGLARYNILDLNEIFFINPYLGLNASYDRLSPVKKQYSSSMNFGLKIGGEIEAVLDDSFSFVGFFNQLVLTHTQFGSHRYDYGIGIRFYLGN